MLKNYLEISYLSGCHWGILEDDEAEGLNLFKYRNYSSRGGFAIF